jgi:hypothetical protein
MHSQFKLLPLVASTLAALMTTAVWANNRPPAKLTPAACETIRRQLSDTTLKSWGYDLMLSRMKRISLALKPDERRDLKRLTSSMDSAGVHPTLQAHSVRMIKSIYGEAIERSGLQKGIAEVHRDLQLEITASPTGSDPLEDGYTVVLGSSRHLPKAPPKVGDITDAFLAVNASQRPQLILVRAKSVVPGAHEGFATEGEYVTLRQYLKTQAPCAALSSR